MEACLPAIDLPAAVQILSLITLLLVKQSMIALIITNLGNIFNGLGDNESFNFL